MCGSLCSLICNGIAINNNALYIIISCNNNNSSSSIGISGSSIPCT